MRGAAAAVIAALGAATSGMAAPAEPLRVDAGGTVSLKAGESAQTGDGAVRIGFDAVIADSRCPKGEQCIWAGDAVVKVWLQRGSGRKETRELHTAAARAPAAAPGALDIDVRLVRLDPFPVSGRTVATGDYVATLALHRVAAAAPER